jgi:hypothetical protein
MKKLLFLFFVFTSATIFAQTIFQKTYGTIGVEEGRFIEKTNDGGYLIAGGTTYFDSTAYDSFVIKVNSLGDTLWTKIISNSNQSEWLTSIKSTSDGGSICLILLDTNWPAYGFLVKLDALGNILWSKKIGPIELVYDLVETLDGGFAFSYSMGLHFGIIKTDITGNVLWASLDSVNSFPNYQKVSLIQTADSGFAITTTINSNYDIYLLKLNPTGNVQWGKLYSTTEKDYSVGLKQTSDLGFIISGTKENTPYAKTILIKTNSIGDTLWTRGYFSPPFGGEYTIEGDIIQNSDGGFSFSTVSTNGLAGNTIFLLRTNSFGNLLWTKRYGGMQDDWPNDILQTSDNGFLITGCTKSFGHANGLCDIYLIKTDSVGLSGCNTSSVFLSTEYLDLVVSNLSAIDSVPLVPITASTYTYNIVNGLSTSAVCFSIGIKESKMLDLEYRLYPNPFYSSTTFEISTSSDLKNSTLEIFDLLGRKLKTIKIQSATTTVHRDNLLPGIYIFQLQAETQTIGSGKFIVQ